MEIGNIRKNWSEMKVRDLEFYAQYPEFEGVVDGDSKTVTIWLVGDKQ